MNDDPFERAAQREAMLHGFGPPRGATWPLVGIQLAWAVLLGLHWWLSEGQGRGFRIHTTVFVVALSFTIFAAVASTAPARWTMFAIVAAWAPMLTLHWVRVGERTPGVVANTIGFACVLAFAIMTFFATPRHDSRQA